MEQIPSRCDRQQDFPSLPHWESPGLCCTTQRSWSLSNQPSCFHGRLYETFICLEAEHRSEAGHGDLCHWKWEGADVACDEREVER